VAVGRAFLHRTENNIHGIVAIYCTSVVPVITEESSNQALLRLQTTRLGRYKHRAYNRNIRKVVEAAKDLEKFSTEISTS